MVKSDSRSWADGSAYLEQNGDAEMQQQAHQQYVERLVDLFIQRSSVSGEIDDAYLAHQVKRYWEDLKVEALARVTSRYA